MQKSLAKTLGSGDRVFVEVVVRQSDNRAVIVYYTSEKDTLDNPNAELWIYNGVNEPRHLTLGKFIKTTGINRIRV